MGRKCPPGVLCIENYTLLVLTLIICGVLVYMWNTSNNKKGLGFNLGQLLSNNQNNPNGGFNMGLQGLQPSQNSMDLSSFLNNAGLRNRPNSDDVLLNPYSAPLRDDRPIIAPPMSRDPRGLPINIPTQGVESNYRQVGILTRINGPETILPLMGKPLIPGRDSWNFYTMSDKNNMIKLPVSFKNKSCTSEYGCDNVYNGDTVYVEGYNDAFKVTAYENNTIKYIPYL